LNDFRTLGLSSTRPTSNLIEERTIDRKLKFQFEFVDGGPRSLDYETTDGDKASISIEDAIGVLAEC